MTMKKILSILLSCALLLSGCSLRDAANSSNTKVQTSVEQDIAEETQSAPENTSSPTVGTSSEEYVDALGFTSLDDPNLLQYVEDTVYSNLIDQIDNDKYFVENVEAVYISKEYLDELAYNSQENLYFGYKLSELDKAFEGETYIFTLGDDGQTKVQTFEEYDDTYEKVIRNVAIGTGVILLCVTVSVVTGGAGAPAAVSEASMILAGSAKTATGFALSSGAISGVSAGVVKGMETGNFDQSVKEAALAGSEGFMWGAITGAVIGGASGAATISALKGADVTANGLTLREAAQIQKESKYSLKKIKAIKSMKEYNVYKGAGLFEHTVKGEEALVQKIDLNIKSKLSGEEVTNLQRMKKGYAPHDSTGRSYELHHIGQKSDGILAVLTKEQHTGKGNFNILHTIGKKSEIDRPEFKKIKRDFWKDLAKQYEQGLIK